MVVKRVTAKSAALAAVRTDEKSILAKTAGAQRFAHMENEKQVVVYVDPHIFVYTGNGSLNVNHVGVLKYVITESVKNRAKTVIRIDANMENYNDGVKNVWEQAFVSTGNNGFTVPFAREAKRVNMATSQQVATFAPRTGAKAARCTW